MSNYSKDIDVRPIMVLQDTYSGDGDLGLCYNAHEGRFINISLYNEITEAQRKWTLSGSQQHSSEISKHELDYMKDMGVNAELRITLSVGIDLSITGKAEYKEHVSKYSITNRIGSTQFYIYGDSSL